MFSPSLIDRELCFESRCQRGDIFVMKDIQQRIVERQFQTSQALATSPRSSTSLRKNASFSSSLDLFFQGSPRALDLQMSEDEIFLFNASSSEVTLAFYTHDTVSFLFQLTKQVQGQRSIPKEQGRMFRCVLQNISLCMRANHGTHELDFSTVQCGHSYTVTDGLID